MTNLEENEFYPTPRKSAIRNSKYLSTNFETVGDYYFKLKPSMEHIVLRKENLEQKK